MNCPKCGSECRRDEADVGVGIIYGPWGCPCGWSEYARYDVSDGPKVEGGYSVDQWGGLAPWCHEDDRTLTFLPCRSARRNQPHPRRTT